MMFLLTALVAFGQPSHDITPEDAFTMEYPGAFTVDRRGNSVVYVKYRWSEDADRMVGDLWQLNTRSRDEKRLTFDDTIEGSPTLTPTGDLLYTSRADGEGSQIFRMDLTTGVTTQLTHVDGGIGSMQLAGSGLYYLSTDHESVDDDFAGLRSTHGNVDYGHDGHEQSSLHRIDIRTWRASTLDLGTGWVMDVAVAPDERRIAVLQAPDVDLITHEGYSNVVVLDTASSETVTLDDTLWRADAPSPYGWLVDLAWSSDGRALGHRVDFDGYPGETFVTEFSDDGNYETWLLPRPREITPNAGTLKWVPGTRELCLTADEQARVKMVCVDGLKRGKVGRDRTFPEGNVVVRRFAFSSDGRDIIATVATPNSFSDLYRLPARGRLLPTRLSNLNPHTADWKLPQLQLVSWTAPDGTTVEGVLETPHGWTKADGPLPLVVSIHGGPTAATSFGRRFSYSGHTAFAAKGWALLSPNYRGSTGYGDTFLVDLVGHENDVEVKDILAGVDALVERGIADPDQLAVMGWSNGGYLTNCLISTTTRFKGASSGAGVFDQTMQWATEDTPGHVINYMKGLPWEQPEHVIEASPLFAADKITTPTLIHVGEFDERVPAVHARALFRALDFYLDVPSELIVYPDTGHGLYKMSHRKAKMAWDHAWFERHVLQTSSSDEEHTDGSADTVEQ